MRVFSIWIVFVACYAPMAFAQAATGDFVDEVVAQRAILAVADWDAKQMIGLPDAPLADDQVTAWAPATMNGQKAWAEVLFAKAINPAEIHIHECCAPGSVYQVSAFINGVETLIWQGADPTPINAGRGVSKIPVETKSKFKKIRIYLNCPTVNGWNEIDAVALVQRNKPNDQLAPKVLWAVDAAASCTYSQEKQVPFVDPFQTEQDRRAEQFASISVEIERLKESVRSYEQAIDHQNEKIKELYRQLDNQ